MMVLQVLLFFAILGFLAYIVWKRGKRVENAFASKLSYVCLVCGRVFRGRQCPKCGSKSKRAMF
jgi:rubrerythrin